MGGKPEMLTSLTAAVGRQVVAQARPPLTRQAYRDFQRKMSRRETYDGARD